MDFAKFEKKRRGLIIRLKTLKKLYIKNGYFITLDEIKRTEDKISQMNKHMVYTRGYMM